MKDTILEVLKFYLDFADPEDLEAIAEKIADRLKDAGARMD